MRNEFISTFKRVCVSVILLFITLLLFAFDNDLKPYNIVYSIVSAMSILVISIFGISFHLCQDFKHYIFKDDMTDYRYDKIIQIFSTICILFLLICGISDMIMLININNDIAIAMYLYVLLKYAILCYIV